MQIRGPVDSYTYVVYEKSKRAHKDLFQKHTGHKGSSGELQCFHTMPLYERLCDKIDPDFRGFQVILGFN